VKVNRLEAHDRLTYFKHDQWETISRGAEECLKTNPTSLAIQAKSPYVYLFAHPRTADDGVTQRMLWQARISRPSPQTNSYLFRANSNTDVIEVCWLLPPRELWDQYSTGKVTESNIIKWSIDQFRYNRKTLAMNHPEDLSEERGKMIYLDVIKSMKYQAI
jgi:hypothetical protein